MKFSQGTEELEYFVDVLSEYVQTLKREMNEGNAVLCYNIGKVSAALEEVYIRHKTLREDIIESNTHSEEPSFEIKFNDTIPSQGALHDGDTIRITTSPEEHRWFGYDKNATE